MLNGLPLGPLFTSIFTQRLLPYSLFTIAQPFNTPCHRIATASLPITRSVDAKGYNVVPPHFQARKADSEDGTERIVHSDGATGHLYRPLRVHRLNGGLFHDGQKRLKVDREWIKLPHHTMVQKPLTNSGGIAATVFEWGAQYDSSFTQSSLYFRLLHVIANTQYPNHGWTAYCSLLEMDKPPFIPEESPKIPLQHLHRLCRLISKSRPKTRVQFLRLLSILYTIRSAGGKVKLFEWNTLLDHAGKGWRKTTTSDFRFALDIFDDMISSRSPGQSIAPQEFPAIEPKTENAMPDVITYTTLVNIASNALDSQATSLSVSMLKASNIPPNRITHLSLLKYHASSGNMLGVRTIVAKMRQENHELGIDGVNALLWAYGRNERLELVAQIYRILRHQVHAEDHAEIVNLANQLDTEQNITDLMTMRPDRITYTMVIQVMAYHGNFPSLLKVFLDMLSADVVEDGAPKYMDIMGKRIPIKYSPSLAIFRSIFLGFARHGVYITSEENDSGSRRPWNVTQLQSFFKMFTAYNFREKPNSTLFYWIMCGFAKTSNNDVALLRSVWTRYEERFGEFRVGRNNRLVFLKEKLFSDEAGDYLSRFGFRTPHTDTLWVND